MRIYQVVKKFYYYGAPDYNPNLQEKIIKNFITKEEAELYVSQQPVFVHDNNFPYGDNCSLITAYNWFGYFVCEANQ